jgi:N-acetylneuraminic acid mutarotase
MNKFCSALLFVIIVTTCFVLSPNLVYSQTSVENSWENKQSISQSFGSNSVVVNDEIYLFDVNNFFQKDKNSIYLYDQQNGNCTLKTTIPTPRSSFFTSVIENKIYVMGGQAKTTPSYPSTANEVYNVLTDTWETKQPLPLQMGEVDANVIDGKIYVIGAGSLGQDNRVVTEVYDPQSDTWEEKNSPPALLDRYYSCVIDDKIFIIQDANAYWFTDKMPHEGKMFIYDAKTDSWSNGTSIPQIYWGSAIAATTGSNGSKGIYVIGGCIVSEFAKTKVVNATFMYNPADDSWTKAADMPTARSSFAVAVIKDKIFTIGGSLDVNGIDGNASYTVEVFTPFGYGSVNGDGLTKTAPIVAGAVVACIVIAATGVTVYHFKHTPPKTSKHP